MAYVTLLSITQSLEQILHPNDQSLVLEDTEQHVMISLKERASFLLLFLENDSLKYSEPNLETRIRDVAYETEAMIESGFPYQNFEESEKIEDELDSILDEVVKMKERNQVKDLVTPTKSLRPSASLESGSTTKTDVVGLRKKMMEIKDRLTGSPSRREIISIIGMPGIGKTTLTKTLYDDPLIVKHFDVCAWIMVSVHYNLQQMLTGLLDSIQNISHDSYPGDLAHYLYKTLKQRRYLIVMDDVWDTNVWDQVKRFFPNDHNGSRIILTTRLRKVADYVECPDSIYRLSLLSSDDSWKLLCQKAFNVEPCPPEFADVGKEIANNCKGLPLSLVVIGGILYKAERTLDYWRYIAQNVSSALNNTDDDKVMSILSFSYKHLPHHLRACFLYMGVFREDHAISKSKIIRLWVAEGFIKPDPSKSLEEVACEYLENLINRNMILVYKRNNAGGIKKCGIHDLMRDLCMRIAQEEKFVKVVYSQLEIPRDYTYNFRHLYIHSNSHNCLAGIYGLPVNSFLSSLTEIPNTNMLSSQPLRVVDVQESSLSLSEDEIGDPVGLRYICFSCTGKGYELQFSITKLLNLQTLVIKYTGKVVMLPLGIWTMPRLRHIKTRKCFLSYPFDAENGENIVPLENLQTLTGVFNFRFTRDAIRMMPNLKKLKIYFKLRRNDFPSYCMDNFVLLHQLEVLAVFFEDEETKEQYRYPLPKNFTLPPKLRKLHLGGFRSSPENVASIGSLQHLEQLALVGISFEGSSWEPTEGEFLQLKYLDLYETDLEYWKADETNFPILQMLVLTSCTKLIAIPSRIGDIQTLESILLTNYSESACDSLALIRMEQQDLGNNRLRIFLNHFLNEEHDLLGFSFCTGQ